MERKEFIEKVGLSGAAILIFGCMQSCSKDVTSSDTQNQNRPPNTSGGDASSNKIDFTIDIGTAPYDVLKNIGGYAIYMESKIIIARASSTEILAVSSVCTHQGATLEYRSNTSKFYCPLHGSNFNQNGSVANGPAAQSLKQYSTSLNGNKLRVFE
jgi:cytochrome b6-f complex iron-sulfur subunit